MYRNELEFFLNQYGKGHQDGKLLGLVTKIDDYLDDENTTKKDKNWARHRKAAIVKRLNGEDIRYRYVGARKGFVDKDIQDCITFTRNINKILEDMDHVIRKDANRRLLRGTTVGVLRWD